MDLDRFDWKIMKTIHFDIHFPVGMKELAVKTAEIAEMGYVHISNYLRHELTQTIPIIVFPSHIAFQNNNVSPFMIGEGTGGFTESLKNRVVIPYTGSDEDFRHVLVHELVHAFQFNILFADRSGRSMSKFFPGRVPLWIAEGLAEYISIGFDETADMVMRDALFNEKFSDLKDLARFRVKSFYMIYKEGQSFFYFLEKKYGKDVIGEFFRDLRDITGMRNTIHSIDTALKINTGKDLDDINKEWIRFYKRRYFHLVKEKKYDDEEGRQVTFHEKTGSSMNICPAISPDGKKIAYITNRAIYSKIVISNIKKMKKKNVPIKVLIKGNAGAEFEGMHLLNNYLTWSKKGDILAFVAQSMGRDILYLINPNNGDIIKELTLPMRAIKDPSISEDGKMITFVGRGNGATDIYLYNFKSKNLKRLTDDTFTDRYPKITGNNKSIIFSSKRDKNNRTGRFNIYKMDIASGKIELLIGTDGNDLQADISPEGDKIIYISNKSGIYNGYIYNMKTKKSDKYTDVLSGVFYPRWFPDEKKIAFVSYQNVGYDIFIKKIDESKPYPQKEKNDTEFMYMDYPGAYFETSKSLFRDYESGITSDWLNLGLLGTFSYGFVGLAQMSFSDLLGNHRIIFTTNFIRQNKKNEYNFDMAYYFLKYRWDFGIGLFRQKNPYLTYSLSGINDLIHNSHFGTLYMDHYGGYMLASYPFNRSIRLDLKGSFGRYERDYSENDSRPDVFANLNIFSASLNYDNVLWGGMIPADGMRGRLKFEHALNITGRDFTYSSMSFDMRKYFLLSKKYIFAFRGLGGRVVGRDSDFFKFYLGGFDTLRGHGLWDYSGNNMFLVSSEFRFTFVEGIKFGWPLFFGIGNIGGVLFVDFGSAWDGKYNFIDNKTGRFDDFKADFGFGFRLAIYPIIILKLDYAWPYDKKSIGSNDIIFSIGFEY